ncbi:MAG TPA: DUF3794 domain-containing protein, partial [Clostridia bacterium]|nr:DUF3794 domain-containing protein [Clostridia bacterium]
SRASAIKTDTKTVVTDIYSTQREVECTYGTMNVGIEKKFSAQSSFRLPAPLAEGMPPIAKVLFCDVHPAVCDTQTDDGKLAVDGVLDTVIIYRAAGAGLCSYHSELPFSCELDLPEITAGTKSYVTAKMLQKSAIITAADETELRAQVRFDILAKDSAVQKVLVSAEEGEEYSEKSAICIYTVQTGDTLWSVAKHLGIKISDLLEFNPDITQVPVPGSKIFAYRQICVN